MTVEERQTALIDGLRAIPDVHERLSALVSHGNRVATVDEADRTPDRLVQGCVSRVWLTGCREADDRWHFQRAADSPLVHGLVGALVGLYEGADTAQIAGTEPTFLDALGLIHHITPTRLRGLAAVREKIRALTATVGADTEKR